MEKSSTSRLEEIKIKFKCIAEDNIGAQWESKKNQKKKEIKHIDKELSSYTHIYLISLNQPLSTLPEIIRNAPLNDGIYEIPILLCSSLPVFDLDLFKEIMKYLKEGDNIKFLLKKAEPQRILRAFLLSVMFQIYPLIKACLKKIKKNLTPFLMVMTFLVSFYYNAVNIKIDSYHQIRKYIYIAKGVSKFADDEIMKCLKSPSDGSRILIADKNKLVLILPGIDKLEISTGIFRTCLHQHYAQLRNSYYKPEMKFTLSKVKRARSDPYDESRLSLKQIILEEVTDYPHYYVMTGEGNDEKWLYATQRQEGSNIWIFSRDGNDFEDNLKYDETYCAVMETNFWGTQFTLYDNGLPKDQFEMMPEGFGTLRRKLLEINYTTNIMGNKPRDQEIILFDEKEKEVDRFMNLPPRYSHDLEVYHMNFYGRVKVASARNFQIINKKDEAKNEKQSTIILMHGKNAKDLFAVDFMFPMTKLNAFAISVSSICKKKLVAQLILYDQELINKRNNQNKSNQWHKF